TKLAIFFSSIRRHTISYGDWSSDVCSSDLSTTGAKKNSRADRKRRLNSSTSTRVSSSPPAWSQLSTVPASGSVASHWSRRVRIRSEERRVGKGCRTEQSLEHE